MHAEMHQYTMKEQITTTIHPTKCLKVIHVLINDYSFGINRFIESNSKDIISPQ